MVGEQEFLDARERTHAPILDELRRHRWLDDPLDLADEIYATAWASRHHYDPARGSLDAWIHGIAANLRLRRHRTHLRRRRAEGRIRDSGTRAGHEERVVAALTAALVLEAVLNAVASLPSVDRELLERVVLAAGEGVPALLIPAQHVRLHRLRRLLRSRAAPST